VQGAAPRASTPPTLAPAIPNPAAQGRGVTDCLGHVALLVELFTQLAEARPKLAPTVVGVFIANEENATLTGIGVDEMVG
jgi:acetylornithine deacetylase